MGIEKCLWILLCTCVNTDTDLTPYRERFMYLASIHSCSYPGCPHRWRCWSRVQSGMVVVVSHSVCQWRLCESNHSCSWDNQGFRNHMNEIISVQSVFTGVKLNSIRNQCCENYNFFHSVSGTELLTHSPHLYTEPRFGMGALGTRHCRFHTVVLGNRTGRCKWSRRRSHGNCRHWDMAVIDTHQSGPHKWPLWTSKQCRCQRASYIDWGQGAKMNKAFMCTGCDHVWTSLLSHSEALDVVYIF